MPYLKDCAREAELTGPLPSPVDGAELNFVITRLVDKFIEDHRLSYHTLEEIDGALGLAQNEFRDRIVRPYEDIKRHQNGDVYFYAAPLIREMQEAIIGL